MIFETLDLIDFGVFKGLQRFDLSPRIKYGTLRPIVLFGGLNGSGKTSVLTAIRIALHGRQALGFGTTQKKYEEKLNQLFHKSSAAAAESMSVRLSFSYSSMGETTPYVVERRWKRLKREIVENFQIFENGQPVIATTMEQTQAFLTKLIPVGVADLFFFDGEKIADLATEDNGYILADSIRRLLGLDVVNKLLSDLDIYERRNLLQSKDEEKIKSNEPFEKLEALKLDIDNRYSKIRQEIEPAISSLRINLDKLEGQLAERGGAWAVSRSSFSEKLDALIEKKKALEGKVRELASSVLPLALAPKATNLLVTQLKSEREYSDISEISRSFVKNRTAVEIAFKNANLNVSVDEIINVVTTAFTASLPATSPVHMLGEQDRERLLNSLESLSSPTISTAQIVSRDLVSVEQEIELVSARIAAAPSEEQLQYDFAMVKQTNLELGELLGRKRLLLEEVKVLTWQQIELVRLIKKNHDLEEHHESKDKTLKYTSSVKNVLNDFSEKLAEEKTAILAENFVSSFKKLVRKESFVHSARVDPNKLTLALFDENGDEIKKSQMSAGERQLFAVAMLDALAKTSGRQIPIIIDTPLGRLDSSHRHNLVKYYLPYASHQVVILSTDTEIDSASFLELGRSISHAFHLDFDHIEKATVVHEGYFWREKGDWIVA